MYQEYEGYPELNHDKINKTFPNIIQVDKILVEDHSHLLYRYLDIFLH